MFEFQFIEVGMSYYEISNYFEKKGNCGKDVYCQLTNNNSIWHY